MSLADSVLPLVRTRRGVHRWDVANDYGAGLHGAVHLLREATQTEPPADVLQVTQKAIDIACKVIMRADDSSGIIGDAIYALLALHAEAACAAPQPFHKLVDWMIAFQFTNECDFFQIDPVAYGPALGDVGMASYKARLDAIAADLGPEPTPGQLKSWALSSDRVEWERASRDRHARFVLELNARRLAVWDRDVAAIIATHQRDRKVAAWVKDTAEALAEIGEFDLAIDWASQATHFDLGHQAASASDYWCALLAEHRPDEELDACLDVFRRWPTAGHAGGLHAAAGPQCQWPAYRDDVMAVLTPHPREAVTFALNGLKDVRLAWELANSLDLDDWHL
ncbi:MAG TPA: hypothetical protein VLR88_02780, partial [Propionibacteriaceae bacterium]|nr:hypothetical protein [Propionibacteriaceae bacterium]